MIVIKIWGGLGNQLFQYAFGYTLAKKNNQPLYMDLDFYKKQPNNLGTRQVGLFDLNIPETSIFNRNFPLKVLNNKYVGAVSRNLLKFSLPIGNGFKYIKEPIHKYVESIKVYENTYYDGYWQTSKYFQEERENILEMFRPKKAFSLGVVELAKTLKSQNSVAVHIRKGDFGSGSIRKVGHILPIEYYVRAMEYCRANLESPTFYIFSDDPKLVKEQLPQKDDIKYGFDCCKMNLYDDLFAISQCRHGIMSASTFSWWGNWMREDSNGIVIVPSKEFYNDHFYEDSWIRL